MYMSAIQYVPTAATNSLHRLDFQNVPIYTCAMPSAFGASRSWRPFFLGQYKSYRILHLSFDLIHTSHVGIEMYAIYALEIVFLKSKKKVTGK